MRVVFMHEEYNSILLTPTNIGHFNIGQHLLISVILAKYQYIGETQISARMIYPVYLWLL